MQRILPGVRRLILLSCLGMCLNVATEAAESGISYFRSDQGLSSPAEAAPSKFDQSHLVWKRALPSGHSSPCLVGDAIVLTTYDAQSNELATVAVDRTDGDLLWKREAPVDEIEAYHRVGSPAAATPATDGERIYVFFGSFGLLCYDVHGKLLWSHSMGPFQDEFGSASSPILVDNLVVLNEDHDTDNALYAIDKRNGELVWRVERNEFTRSYSTPIVAQVDGETQIVVPGALTLTGYRAETGERRWWIHGLARIVNPTPVLDGNLLVMPTWSPGGDVGERVAMEPWPIAAELYDKNKDGLIHREELGEGPVLTRFFRIDIDQNGGLDRGEWEKHAAVFERARNSVLAIRLGGEGDLTDTNVVWSYAKGVPYVASPLVSEGVTYLVKDGGILTSLDMASGKPRKQGRLKGRGSYYASPYLADGKIYLANESGVMTVTTASPDWEILESHDFREPIYATPLVRDGRMYLRTEAALYCFAAD